MSAFLDRLERVIAQGPYSDSWESLSEFQPPRWFNRLKFGIFLHWGVYSVPAFANEWYSRNMYIQGTREFEHHVQTYGPHAQFGYKDYIPMFKAEKFDPDAWAALFEAAGARYVVPVAEHHDGFQMYRSDLSHWNAWEMGPKRDVLGELTASCRARGMVTGASSHRVEHWFFMGHGREFESDIREPMARGDFYWPAMPEPADHHDLFSEPTPTAEFLEDWAERTCEIIDRYHPSILYFDWWIQHSAVKPWLKKVAAYYYNRGVEWGQDVLITYKHDAFQFGCAVPDVERGQFADVKPYYWQSDTAAALNSWCYTTENVYKAPEELVHDLVDIVSKNGCLLLNVGPKPDGTFTPEDEGILRAIGAWMRVNGEAIYDSRPWRKFGEGPTQIVEGQFADGIRKAFTSRDFRFTTAKGVLYATALRGSETGEYNITSLAVQDASRVANFHGIVRDVSVLGQEAPVTWTRDEEGLHVHAAPAGEMPVVIRLTID